MNLNELAKEVHQNAVEHGWWEQERSTGEIIALCHSELSEALEEYRKGFENTAIYFSKKNGSINTVKTKDYDKPEGIAVELADCVIRILDYFGKTSYQIDNNFYTQVKKFWYWTKEEGNFGDFINKVHDILSTFSNAHNLETLVLLIAAIERWFDENNINFEETLLLKHEYNKTRPYKHGGKVI